MFYTALDPVLGEEEKRKAIRLSKNVKDPGLRIEKVDGCIRFILS
jgi:hypothetical protein